jgi:SAM-dependent methyltransferase
MSLSREVLRHHYDRGERPHGAPAAAPVMGSFRLGLLAALQCAQLTDLSGRDVLELGCGFGEVALSMSQEGARVTAVDSSPARLDVGSKVASEYGLAIDWVPAALGDWRPSGEARFDLVVLGAGWLSEGGWRARRGVLQRISASLRSGGALVVRQPASALRVRWPPPPLNVELRGAGFRRLQRTRGDDRAGNDTAPSLLVYVRRR